MSLMKYLKKKVFTTLKKKILFLDRIRFLSFGVDPGARIGTRVDVDHAVRMASAAFAVG